MNLISCSVFFTSYPWFFSGKLKLNCVLKTGDLFFQWPTMRNKWKLGAKIEKVRKCTPELGRKKTQVFFCTCALDESALQEQNSEEIERRVSKKFSH